MKKLLLSLMLVAGLGYAATAQKTPAKGGVKIGVKAGVNLAKIVVTGLEGEEKDIYDKGNKMNTSFYIGGIVDVPVSSMFSVQPGLTLSGKGGKVEYTSDGGGASIKNTNNVMYIEVPVNAVVNFQAGAGKFFVGAGPYFGMGITGKSKSEVTIGGVTEKDSEDVKFGSEADETKRTDFGANFLLGYQLKNGLNLHAGYGLGLSNTSNSDQNKTKNNVISVGLGFTF